jgi:hypothetical protein
MLVLNFNQISAGYGMDGGLCSLSESNQTKYCLDQLAGAGTVFMGFGMRFQSIHTNTTGLMMGDATQPENIMTISIKQL